MEKIVSKTLLATVCMWLWNCNPEDENNSETYSIIGEWVNTDCTKHQSDGTQKLWYNETYTITENTMDSVNQYFTDSDCSSLDSYQPSPTEEGEKIKYMLGQKVDGFDNTYELDISYPESLNLANMYTIVSFDSNYLKFGGGNSSEDGKTSSTRINDLGDRKFKRK